MFEAVVTACLLVFPLCVLWVVQENRRQYRELFYTAEIGGGVSGAILFEVHSAPGPLLPVADALWALTERLDVQEALYQSASDGTPFVECLRQRGVLPGVKVDEAGALFPLLTCQPLVLCCCSHTTSSAATARACPSMFTLRLLNVCFLGSSC